MNQYGKVPPDVLSRLLGQVTRDDPRVVIGPRVGEDAAVLDFGDRCLVAKSDPVTFAAERIGWYAVHVNANDVATMGARPRWFLATLLLPPGQAGMAEPILADVAAACSELGVTLVGGHTEMTPGLDRPVVCGHMLGEVATERLVRKERVRPGDLVLLTHGVAIEGTAILAREKGRELAGRVPPAVLERSCQLLFQPGISVVADALAATAAADVHAMHDPTEGGLVGGLYELAHAAGAGLEVEGAAIPVLPETAAVCAAFGLDSLRLIASGALLLAVAEADAAVVQSALERRGTPCVAIGRLTDPSQGLRMDGEPFSFPDRDEISRLFE